MNLRFSKSTFGSQTGVWAAVLTAGALARASTEPIRNAQPCETVQALDSSHPIYFPIAVSPLSPEPVAAETLLRQFMERHTAMDYPAAVEAAMRLISVAPDRPEGHYNLACALARLRRTDEALNALEAAIKQGWRDLEHTAVDPDLAT